MKSKSMIFLSSLCVAAIVGMQLHKFHTYFPTWRVFWSDTPLRHVDYAILEYQIFQARQFFENHGTLWGWDPYFLQGYPASFLFNSNVFLQIIGVLFPSVSIAWVLKAFVAGIWLLEPLLLYGTLRNFDFSKSHSWLGAFLGVAFLKAGFANVFIIFGMLTGYLAFFMMLYGTSLLFRMGHSQKKTFLQWASLSAWWTLSVLVHKTSFFLWGVLGGIVWWDSKYHKTSYGLPLWGSMVLVIGLNAFWLIPAFSFRHLLDFSHNAFWQDPLYFLSETVTLAPYHQSASFYISLLIILLGALGLLRLMKTLESRLHLFCWVPVVWCFFWGALGHSLFGLEGAHLSRFLFLGVSWLLLPALYWVSKQTPFRQFGTVAVVLLAVSLLPAYDNATTLNRVTLEQMPVFFSEPYEQHRQQHGHQPQHHQTEQVAQWLKENTDNTHNRFMEISEWNAHLPILMPAWTNLRFLNAPYAFFFFQHNQLHRFFHECWDSHKNYLPWPKEPQWKPSCEEFAKWSQFFNVRWWVVHTSQAQGFLTSLPFIHETQRIGRYAIYEDTRVMSDFLVGNASVQLSYGQIQLSNIQWGPDQTLILKWHWLPGIKSSLGVVTPYYYEGYSLPFIQITTDTPLRTGTLMLEH